MGKSDEPYIKQIVTVVKRLYNPDYGDKRICECGHQYYRHFDGYEDNLDVGCKYCSCWDFKEKKPIQEVQYENQMS